MMRRTLIAGVLTVAGAALGAPVERPAGEPLLVAQDEQASVEAWARLPEQPMDLLGRFEAIVEVRADAAVRVDGWSIGDAFGDAMLVTVVDGEPLERGELGGWFGRYAVVVEPLIDGDVDLGPLRLVYLIDPDPETDPTELEPERVVIESDAIAMRVRGPGGEVPERPSGPKPAAEPEPTFDWRPVLIAGAATGVAVPTVVALALAMVTGRRRKRSEAPGRCIEELDALERVVRAGGESGMAVDSAAVAGEALGSVRSMLDDAYGMGTRGLSGPEMLKSPQVRSALSAEAFDRLRNLVERSESVRFAGASLDEARAIELIGCARGVARAVADQQGGRG